MNAEEIVRDLSQQIEFSSTPKINKGEIRAHVKELDEHGVHSLSLVGSAYPMKLKRSGTGISIFIKTK